MTLRITTWQWIIMMMIVAMFAFGAGAVTGYTVSYAAMCHEIEYAEEMGATYC